MTKIDRHFLLLYGVICFTLYTRPREIARNHLSYFVACKCVIYFPVPYLEGPKGVIHFLAHCNEIERRKLPSNMSSLIRCLLHYIHQPCRTKFGAPLFCFPCRAGAAPFWSDPNENKPSHGWNDTILWVGQSDIQHMLHLDFLDINEKEEV